MSIFSRGWPVSGLVRRARLLGALRQGPVRHTGSMRVFVALPLPEALRESLDTHAEIRRDADRPASGGPGGRSDWSWTLPDQWHVTLAFAGEVGPDRLDRWDELLCEVTERTAPFRARLSGAGAFPHPDRAKVLHLGVREVDDPDPYAVSAATVTLARAVRTAARRCGVEVDQKRFVPHLTLARSRRGVSATRWMRTFDALALPEWQVDRMQLVESQWSGPGRRAVHRVEAEYRLGT